jgi:predicted RNase H-like HicB family nuclease
MDYIDKALEKLKEWIDKVIDALLGPQAQPEPELIPIPVDDRNPRRH